MDKNSNSGGIALVEALTIVFVVLKLTGLITWSWWWVLSPLWITALIVIAIIAVLLVAAIVRAR